MAHLTAAAPRPVEAAPWNPWLMLVLQLPVQRANQRVKTWRRLQQLGAISVKNAVYVLPNSTQAVEDFEWVRTEVESAGGHASIFSAALVEGASDADLIAEFRAARAEDYRAFLKDVRAAQRRFARAPRGDDEAGRAVRQLRERLTRLAAVDFFQAEGREPAEREQQQLEQAVRRSPSPAPAAASGRLDPTDYRSRIWMTRPRPGVDRFASAWLISRFIDRDATFVFGASPGARPEAVAFDMFGGAFGHEGDACTFEVLARRFQIADPAIRRMAEIVHDIDLNDERFRPIHAAGLRVLVDGLRAAFADDDELLRQGMTLFEALYRGLQTKAALPAQRMKGRRSGGSK